MKIKNIYELKRSINRSSIQVFLIILCLVLIALYLTHNKFVEKKYSLNEQEISSASNIYKSNLSEKLSIIASSTVFIDYLNSGKTTRNILYSQFLSQVYSLKSKSISGMVISDASGNEIFRDGMPTSSFVSLKLCYLNQTLDSSLGDCRYSWTLYFKKMYLLKELMSINNAIRICDKCSQYDFVNSTEFGSFIVKNSSRIELQLKIEDENDHFFYIYFFLMIIALALFGIWSWHRLNSILTNYITNPINNLTSCLKTDEPIEQKNNIEEIKFLINEINTWKYKLNKSQSDKNAAIIGKIAAQLAHDVRSPLSAINMLVKNLTNVPEAYRVTLLNATQRISDIANNFLSQYKKPLAIANQEAVLTEHIPSILECMISEKRSQYCDRNIDIKLFISNDAWHLFSRINSIDFKIIISNLVNNSIEAIEMTGYVHITLSKIQHNLLIEIMDNGRGIASDLLPDIIKKGLSIGKQGGFGLGLSHAIRKTKEWQGNLSIKSEINTGTKISITLPLSKEIPQWFNTSIYLTQNTTICILDDEPHSHHAWKVRIENIFPNKPMIKNFFTQKELHNFINYNLSADVLYLIDHDLGNNSNGLDLIKNFNIHGKAMLVTNRYDEVEIQNKCVSLGIKIIPKNLIPHIPINIIHSSETPPSLL